MDKALHKSRVLVLCSGGVDSMGCLKYYLRLGASVTALYVDYGQPAASKEQLAVERITSMLRVPLRIASVTGITIPDQGFIVGRNLLLAAVATAFGANEWHIIALGIHSGTSYSDCSENFLQRMQACIDVYSDGSMIVEAPFVRWRKDEVWAFVQECALPVECTYSCERGAEPACGICASCTDREALNALTA